MPLLPDQAVRHCQPTRIALPSLSLDVVLPALRAVQGCLLEPSRESARGLFPRASRSASR